MELKKQLHPQVYQDFLNIVGLSYLVSDEKEEQTPEQQKHAKVLKQSFNENIIPPLESRLNEMCTNLRICFAIAEGKSSEEIN